MYAKIVVAYWPLQTTQRMNIYQHNATTSRATTLYDVISEAEKYAHDVTYHFKSATTIVDNKNIDAPNNKTRFFLHI